MMISCNRNVTFTLYASNGAAFIHKLENIMANTITFKTRLVAKGVQFATNASLNWDGVTKEQMEELASRSIIIATQSMYRTAEHVPAKDSINVAELLKRERGGGFVATPENVLAKVSKMSVEDINNSTLPPEVKAFMLKLRK